MIRIRFVGDGNTEKRTLPNMVAKILGVGIEASNHHWARLNTKENGYPKKLKFAAIQARDAGEEGLVAVVDRDRAAKGERLKELREGRDAYRAKNPPLPTALGEADPHGEAWLLDDPAALREVLQLPAEVEIVTVRRTNDPKRVVNDLMRSSGVRNEKVLDVLDDIAKQLNPDRCHHKKETGFGDWVDEVRSELGPLVSPTENP